MQRVRGDSRRDPVRRVLVGTANALRARRQLPARDPRRASARWLRPNWPDALLLDIHRDRLIDALMRDKALRQEVRAQLRIPPTPTLGGELSEPSPEDQMPASIPKRLADAIAAADDPVAILEAAATDQDPAVAVAAAPYLKGELPLPTMAAAPVHQTTSAEPDQELRRKVRESDERAKSLRRDLRGLQKEAEELRRQLSAATDRAERAEANVTELRRQLPSRQERDALASASSQYERTAELQRRLNRERSARRAESRQLHELVSEAEAALGRTQERLDAETRGRRRLEADLGDAAGRARRLVPLAEREAAALRRGAHSMPDGQDKTRQLRRAKQLEALSTSLRELYRLDMDGSPETGADMTGDTGHGSEVLPPRYGHAT
jgi:hypothetical protein